MYGKLFSSMFDGTLATKGPWQALVTFQQLVILADRHGDVDMTAEAISRRTTIPLEYIQTGLIALAEPDLESRSPELNGRRIVPLSDTRSWGWRIVNYVHYRNMRSLEERREYMRNYQRARRAKEKSVNPNVNNVTHAVSSMQYAEKFKRLVAVAPPEIKKAVSKNGSRLQDGWQLPEDWQAWAVKVFHADPQKVYRLSLDFRDYWHAKPGKDAVKLDWLATWRRWCRKEFEHA